MFKIILGKCNAQFISNDQQDSQEYLSFLIDALHEELNLRNEKPFINNPNSKDRDPITLGLECWSNALQRDWSFIFFLFYGQMRSVLNCLECKTESTTFELFSNTPLSLPEPTQQTICIILYRLPNRVKDILNNKVTQQKDGTFALPSFYLDEQDAAGLF